MTDPRNPRGQRREDELIEAGLALLGEGGWPAVTHRAVATRAGTNPGLVHYYFKGTPGLRRAVARRAAATSIATVIDDVLAADGMDEMVAVLNRTFEGTRADDGSGRVIAGLVSAAFDDAEIRDIVRAEFADGRYRLEQRLRRYRPSWPAGRAADVATIVVAVVDGLMLHVLLDPELPAQRLATTLHALAVAAEDSWSDA